MGVGDYLILFSVLLCLIFSVVWMHRRKKQGKGCCGNCTACGCSGACEKKPK